MQISFQMNICLVNNLYPPINTGSSHYTYDLAHLLSNKGHNVVVITNKVKGLPDFEETDRLKIYRLKAIKLPQWQIWLNFPDFNFTLIPSNFKIFKRILITEDIQLIHQCKNIFDMVFLSAYYSKKLKLPLCCSLTTPIQHGNRIFNKILEVFDKTIIKHFFSKRVNEYIALDNETKKYIQERYNRYKQISLIPFSVSNSILLDNLFSLNRNYNNTTYKMVSLGHVSEGKSRIETIKAWWFVVDKIPQAKLVIIGALFSPIAKGLISKLGLEENIIFTGRIKHDEIDNYLIDADFGGVLDSSIAYSKGLGIANLEIMASGIPAVVDIDDDFFGANYPIKNNEHYIKVESRDPKWLAQKYIELFENPNLRQRIGLKGRKFSKDVLTWDRIIDDIEELYKNQIDNNN